MSAAMLSAILLTVSVAALFAVALVDLRNRIVPNRLVLVVAACGVGRRLLSAPGLIWFDLLAAASIVVALGFLAHHEWIGGGDVKLIAAVTLLFPFSDAGALLLGIAVAGGLIGLAYLAMRATATRIPKPGYCPADPREDTQDTPWGLEHLLSGERMRIAAGEPMPYALAVLGGVIYRIVSEAIQCLSATSCSL
jgi:prepilin peptidase CpaA